ncbi:hypothetical protein J6P51_04415 [bacterium]|nr:hypothetical protein [bacterium]
MKKIIRVLAGSFLATTALTTAIVAPIKVTKNNSNLSIISSNTNKPNITIINQDKIKTHENTNINSILLSQVSQSKMDNMINNYFGFNSSNKDNNLLFVQTSTTYNSNYKKIVQLLIRQKK